MNVVSAFLVKVELNKTEDIRNMSAASDIKNGETIAAIIEDIVESHPVEAVSLKIAELIGDDLYFTTIWFSNGLWINYNIATEEIDEFSDDSRYVVSSTTGFAIGIELGDAGSPSIGDCQDPSIISNYAKYLLDINYDTIIDMFREAAFDYYKPVTII